MSLPFSFTSRLFWEGTSRGGEEEGNGEDRTRKSTEWKSSPKEDRFTYAWN